MILKYFGHNKLGLGFHSFIRAVNGWIFRRVTSGKDKDSYYHELFLRGRWDLMGWMKRQPTLQEDMCRKGGRVPVNWQLSKVSPLPEEDVSSVGGGLKLTKKMFWI